MATYRKRGASWRAEVHVNGQRASATFPSKTEARAWAQQQEAVLQQTRAQRVADCTLGDVLRRYMAEVVPAKRGARTETIRLQRLCTYPIAAIKLPALTVDVLAAWKDVRAQEVGAASVRREMGLVGHALEIARREWRWIDVNVARDVRRPPAPRARTRRIADSEIEQLCLALGFDETPPEKVKQRVAVAMLFAIETAMRAGEICGISPKDVDLGARTVHLSMTKNGFSRDVPLSMRAVGLLELLQPWGETVFQLKPTILDVTFRKAKARCGIADIHFHDTRREATSRLSKKLGVMELARMTGHTDLKMLMVYYQEPASELAKKL